MRGRPNRQPGRTASAAQQRRELLYPPAESFHAEISRARAHTMLWLELEVQNVMEQGTRRSGRGEA
ncbi:MULTISPECIES: hypothetical protein [Solimonas]|uniref:hypothetical protein n=1 Tax=Solimonas TaxID=413435 RepID=UPI0003606E58|nr:MULTISPECIES: hypothetical protein [Solimonas]